MKKYIPIAVPILLFFGVLSMPPEWFHMPGLTIVEQRVIAIFLAAAACWVLEPIPIFATSVLAISLELLMVSNRGLFLFTQGKEAEGFGKLLSYSEIFATFASPIIMLFMGGFFLAMAATKYRLDINLARVILKPFGNKPHWILLGLMTITAVFSMFMSNTATTAMMLAVLTPVLSSLPDNDNSRAGFALSIPVAANIGGIGTPIGTPPNAIAMQYITKVQAISFGEWMLFAVPFVAVLLLFSWALLCYFFPTKQKTVTLSIKGVFMKSRQAIIVYIVFALTVLLWMMGDLHGMNSYVVAMIPVAVFTCAKIITREDLKTISWDVLWLLSGGIALGLALEKTGLAARMVNSIPFAGLSPFLVLLAASLLTLVMANFMSHTATANLLLPLMAAVATGMTGLESMGGAVGLLLAVTFAASLGMSLPISTPPNALASATGMVTTRDMAKVGVIVGLVGLVLTFATIWIVSLMGLI